MVWGRCLHILGFVHLGLSWQFSGFYEELVFDCTYWTGGTFLWWWGDVVHFGAFVWGGFFCFMAPSYPGGATRVTEALTCSKETQFCR